MYVALACQLGGAVGDSGLCHALLIFFKCWLTPFSCWFSNNNKQQHHPTTATKQNKETCSRSHSVSDSNEGCWNIQCVMCLLLLKYTVCDLFVAVEIYSVWCVCCCWNIQSVMCLLLLKYTVCDVFVAVEIYSVWCVCCCWNIQCVMCLLLLKYTVCDVFVAVEIYRVWCVCCCWNIQCVMCLLLLKYTGCDVFVAVEIYSVWCVCCCCIFQPHSMSRGELAQTLLGELAPLCRHLADHWASWALMTLNQPSRKDSSCTVSCLWPHCTC